jgi:hypothetical protein
MDTKAALAYGIIDHIIWKLVVEFLGIPIVKDRDPNVFGK